MTDARKFCVQKSNIVDTRNIERVWHTAVIKRCKVCLWCQIVMIITVNTWCIAHSQFQRTVLTQNDLPLVIFNKKI